MPVKFSLVIPTYNEAANIREICRQLKVILESQGFSFEIIIVDDHSPDGTGGIADDLARSDTRIKLISRDHKKGLATAVVEGWSKAEGDILGVMDADLQHPTQTLAEMLKRITSDKEIDIVVASRNFGPVLVSGRALWRRALAGGAAFLSVLFIPGVIRVVKDPMSGYFILRKEVISGRKLVPVGYKILLEVLVRGRYKNVVEVPYVFGERKSGRSKSGIKEYFLSLIHLIRLSQK